MGDWLTWLGIAAGVAYVILGAFGAAVLNGYDITARQVDADTLP